MPPPALGPVPSRKAVPPGSSGPGPERPCPEVTRGPAYSPSFMERLSLTFSDLVCNKRSYVAKAVVFGLGEGFAPSALC